MGLVYTSVRVIVISCGRIDAYVHRVELFNAQLFVKFDANGVSALRLCWPSPYLVG